MLVRAYVLFLCHNDVYFLVEVDLSHQSEGSYVIMQILLFFFCFFFWSQSEKGFAV